MENLFSVSFLILLLPLLLIQISLIIFCLIKINREGVGNLSKTIWILIVLFVNMAGPIAFLLFGRNKDDYDSEY